MKKMGNNIIDSELPSDILLQILLLLQPFSKLFTCRLVSKNWNKCISSFKFDSNLFITQISRCRRRSRNRLHCVDLNPNRSEGVNLVGSFKLHPSWSPSSTGIVNICNGLLCILNGKRVAILNPMTNEYMELPSRTEYQSSVYGLGYSPKTKQYKVARHSFKNDELFVEILAFGTSLADQDGNQNEVQSQWRHVVSISTTYKMHRHGTYFNGAIYWVGEGERSDSSAKNVYVLRRLNVTNEKFEELWLPEIGSIWKHTSYCGVFNGKLYLSHYVTADSMYHVLMMNGKGLWETPFFISIPRFYKGSTRLESNHFQLIKPWKKGKILCLFYSFLLVLFDTKSGKLEKLDYVEEEVKKSFRICHMDSIHFGSLPNILAGK
ncbi:F-box/LRR-repeat protein At2g43260-like [Cucumis melo]|uniref:F-box/LRR-repeat protein At2g43260-like n=1 Tax=Cucumis melo TaxID=3656 RepID=A0A1S3BGK6_CUCME|nr:F-box/LRR-repeat protein At2g43260-like [Cucumis melo]